MRLLLHANYLDTMVCYILFAFITMNKFGYFSGDSVAISNAYFGRGNGSILLTDLGCTGTEISLFSCSHGNAVIGSTGCMHSHDSGVICSPG